MKFQDVINKRHSIREYEKKQVPQSVLKELIINATKAPSGANTQPWVFYVIQSKKKRDKMAEIIRDYYKKSGYKLIQNHKYKNILENFYVNLGDAPCLIFVFYKTIKGFPNPVLSASAILAAGNLINAAVEKGLGTCWINSFLLRRKKISEILKVPKDQKLVAPLIVGYPKKRYKPLIREKRKFFI